MAWPRTGTLTLLLAIVLLLLTLVVAWLSVDYGLEHGADPDDLLLPPQPPGVPQASEPLQGFGAPAGAMTNRGLHESAPTAGP